MVSVSESVLLYAVVLMIAVHFTVNIIGGFIGGTTRWSYLLYWGFGWAFAVTAFLIALQVLPQVI